MKKGRSRKIKHAVVIVNYNGWQDTIDCVKSIDQSKDAPHIIVIDNGSANESVDKLRAQFPDLDLIISPTNLGFAGGNNLGIKRALRLGAQVIYLLNNDTIVDSQLFFRAYRAAAGKDKIIGAKIYYAKGYEYHPEQKGKGNILWYAGGHMDWTNVIGVHEGVDEEDSGQYDTSRKVEFVTGCFMALPRRVIQKIGLLPESYFLYLEDMDYCVRAQKAGIDLVYNPSLIVYHRNGGSSGAGSTFVDYYMTRNRLLLGRTYGSFRLQFALFREAVTRNWNNKIRRAAFIDFMTGKFGNRNDFIKTLTMK